MKTITKAQAEYLDRHRDDEPSSIAAATDLPIQTVRAQLKKLPPKAEEPKPEPAKKNENRIGNSKFEQNAPGVVSLTPQQASEDDPIVHGGKYDNTRAPGRVGQGLHIMDPSKPVR